MTVTELALTAAAVMFGVNAWFTRRLVTSLDTFKQNVYATLKEHGEELATVRERHRIEDGSSPLFVHRRATDVPQ